MRKMLGDAGIEVVVATLAGELITTDSTELKPDLKLSDVRVADYQGFILPCMAAGASPAAAGTIAMVEKAVAEGKPVAAQQNAIRTLAKAGVLVDKKYAFYNEVDVTEHPDFKGALYSGSGVVQDGNMITSGICPYAAKLDDLQDGTKELTQKLITVIN
jgi:putative intracellular protease/amidase